jgi:antitoxin MazE
MKTAVRKWGNSLAIRIPRTFAQETLLDNGTIIDLEVKTGAIVIRRSNTKRHSLKQLLSRIRSSNQHSEQQWGAPVGHEIW